MDGFRQRIRSPAPPLLCVSCAAREGANPFGPGGNNDVYVVRVNPDGSSLGYVSFIGSSGNDAHAVSPTSNIALDASNNAYITGDESLWSDDGDRLVSVGTGVVMPP